jgi:hypothetical protein
MIPSRRRPVTLAGAVMSCAVADGLAGSEEPVPLRDRRWMQQNLAGTPSLVGRVIQK